MDCVFPIGTDCDITHRHCALVYSPAQLCPIVSQSNEQMSLLIRTAMFLSPQCTQRGNSVRAALDGCLAAVLTYKYLEHLITVSCPYWMEVHIVGMGLQVRL